VKYFLKSAQQGTKPAGLLIDYSLLGEKGGWEPKRWGSFRTIQS